MVKDLNLNLRKETVKAVKNDIACYNSGGIHLNKDVHKCYHLSLLSKVCFVVEPIRNASGLILAWQTSKTEEGQVRGCATKNQELGLYSKTDMIDPKNGQIRMFSENIRIEMRSIHDPAV